MHKGSIYEQQVAEYVEREILSGFEPGLARVRRKPRYYSTARGKDIEFDVSIEVFRKGATDPFLIWIWECKASTNPVPVDDVEEFHAKLNQVGADKTKGTMIASNSFASGGESFARSMGIGLCRWIPPNTPVWILEDSSGPNESGIRRALTTPDPTDFRNYGDFYALTTDGAYTTDREQLIRSELSDAK